MSSRRRGNFGLLRNFRYYYPFWGGVVALLASLLAGALVGFAIQYYLSEWLGAYTTLVSYVALFVPAMCFASSRSGQYEMVLDGYKLSSSHFRPVGASTAIAAAVLATIAAGFVLDPLMLLLPPMPDWLQKALEELVKGNFLVNFLCVCVAAPFFEEWLCRGMVLRGLLCNDVNPRVAIPVSAFFFALIHLNPWQALPAFVIGCLMGWVYFRTGSLYLTMLMHFVNNGLALMASRIPGLENMTSWSEVMPTVVYVLVVVLAAVLLYGCIWILSKIRLRAHWGNIDKVHSLFR